VKLRVEKYQPPAWKTGKEEGENFIPSSSTATSPECTCLLKMKKRNDLFFHYPRQFRKELDYNAIYLHPMA
jgi:hypothetical protein